MRERFETLNSSPADRGLSALPWLAGFGLCSLPVFLGLLNHDVAWMLYAADRVLAGQRLYVDVVEVNPPLIIWLGLAPIVAARALAISPILSFRLMMLGVLAGSMLLSRWALVRWHPEQSSARRPVLILTMIALLPLAGYDFGQREHLMLGLFLPYLPLASARAEGRPMGPGMPWVIGLAAGVGIAIKPQFLPLWVAIEAYLAWARRGWHAWPRPEALAVVSVGLSYGVAVLALAPEYLSMTRWVLPLYARCGQAPFSALVSNPATAVTAVASLGFLALRPRGELREPSRLLLVADLALLAVAFIQDKGFSYHFYPALATGLMLIGLLASEGPDPESRLAKPSLLVIRGFLAFLLIATSAARVGDSLLWRGAPGESDTIIGRMIRLARESPPSGSVFTFSPAVAASFPAVLYGEVRWSSRYPCLYFLTGLYPEGLRPGQTLAGRTPGEMGQVERLLLASVVNDLLRERPTLLFVDEMENKPAFNGGRFDFLEYYSIDPRFAGFLADYERITDADMFGVYRRKGRRTNPRGG